MDADDRRIGVVIATRDRRDILANSLARLSVLAESPAIVVVDNGSLDGTPDAVRRTHPAVRVIDLGSDAGPAARTIGARALDERPTS